MTRLKTSASAIGLLPSLLSASADALLVQVQQAAVAVVCVLQRLVGVTVVAPAELVLGVERRGVQRLVAAERGDLVLHQAVVIAFLATGRQRHRAPEPEVLVPHA